MANYGGSDCKQCGDWASYEVRHVCDPQLVQEVHIQRKKAGAIWKAQLASIKAREKLNKPILKKIASLKKKLINVFH